MDEKELNIENENENENETTEVITDTEKEETSVKEDEPEKENKPVKKESVKKAKKPMSRKMKHSLISGAICIFVAAAVVLLNIISFTLTSKYSVLTADITKKGSFELTETSRKLAKSIKKDTEITFLSEKNSYTNIDPYCKQTAFLAEELEKNSDGNISVKYTDIVKTPSLAKKYSDEELSSTDIIVSCGDKYKILKATDIFNFGYYADTYGYITSSKAEQMIDAAVLTVNNEQVTNVLIINDNTAEDYSYLKETLSSNGYTVKEGSLSETNIDKDTDMLVAYAPKKDYTEEIIKKIREFLYNDGKYGKTLLYLSESGDFESPNIDKLLGEYGMEIEHALAFELNRSKLDTKSNNPYDGIICGYYSELYTENLKSKDQFVITGYSRPVYRTDEKSVTPLLVLSSSSGECPFSLRDEEWDINDYVTGMECVLAQGTKGDDNAVSTVVVSGSYNIFTENYYGSVYANQEYLSTMLDKLNGRDTERVSIAEKVISEYDINIDRNLAMTLGFLVYAVIPLAILAAGFTMYIMRRHR